MGANISAGVSETDPPMKPRLGDIPESCVALVLMYLDPPEICKLARLNRAFRGASSADFIWESKLPPNYLYIMEKVFDEETLRKFRKKDVYARLCRPIPFDNSTKVNPTWPPPFSFLFCAYIFRFIPILLIRWQFRFAQELWLDKISGDVCISISSKALRITGIDDRRYWNHISTEETR